MLSFTLIAGMILQIASPIIVSANVQPPKSKHLPQIVIPGPGGTNINTWNGNMYYSIPLMGFSGRGLPVTLSLNYNSTWHGNDSAYGYGWQFGYNIYYTTNSNNDFIVTWEDGRSETFTNSSGTYIPSADTYNTLTQYQTGKFKIVNKEGIEYYFDDSSTKKITKIQDQFANANTFTYTSGVLSRISHASGKYIDLTYTSGKLTQLTDPSVTPNRVINIQYDSGNISQISDLKNNLTKFYYNAEHFLIKITDVAGTNTNLGYTNNVITSVVNDQGPASYVAYDQANRMTKVVNTSNNTNVYITKYFYDTNGRISKLERGKDLNGGIVTQEFTWDNNNNLLTFKDELGRITTNTYDTKGNILTITDALNNVTTYTYESTFNRVASVTDARNKTSSYQYDNKGNLLKSIDPYLEETIYTYDTNGDLLTVTNPLGKTTTYAYNSNGFQTQTTDALSHTQTNTYDELGRLLTSTDPNNNTITYTYDINGNKTSVTNALGKTTTFLYNANNQVGSQTDANGKVTTFNYDLLGRMTSQVDGDNKTTTYVYDSLGNLESTTDPKGNTIKYFYDNLGRLIKERDALGKVITYVYDAVGNLLTKKDSNGNTATYSYDSLNRLTAIDYPDDNDISYTYDAVGNVLTESNPNATVTRTYDSLNRVSSVNAVAGTINKTVSYTYNDAGNRATMTDAESGVTTYTYDDANRLTSLTNPKSQVTSYVYDNGNRLTKKTLGNGVNSNYVYDAGNQVTSITNKKADNSTLSTITYSYDFVGNRTQMVNGSETTSYTYDNVYRLKTTTYPDSSVETFNYDSVGNRTSVVKGGTTSYTYDANNQMLTAGSLSYTWDHNGNMTKKSDGTATTQYAYDSRNSLRSVTLPDSTTNTYKYYPDGKRLSTTDKNGVVTYFLYDGDNELTEMNSSGTVTARMTSGGTDQWLSMDQGANSYYYTADALGSINTIYDSSQSAVNTYKYDSFGNITNQTGSLTNRYTYTGRELDKDTGIYYYRARYYDSSTGRFTQEDPVPYQNLYAYVHSNPINLVDPSGKNYEFPIGASIFFSPLQLGPLGSSFSMNEQWETNAEASIGLDLGVGSKLIEIGSYWHLKTGDNPTFDTPYSTHIGFSFGFAKVGLAWGEGSIGIETSLAGTAPGPYVSISSSTQSLETLMDEHKVVGGMAKFFNQMKDPVKNLFIDLGLNLKASLLSLNPVKKAYAAELSQQEMAYMRNHFGNGASGGSEFGRRIIINGIDLLIYQSATGQIVIVPQPGSGQTYNSPKAILYGDSNYGGGTIESGQGGTNDPNLGGSYKSLAIPSGWSVVLKDKPLGQVGHTECFSSSQPLLESTSGLASNQSIDSFEVHPNNICPAPAQDPKITICWETGGIGKPAPIPCRDVISDIPSMAGSGFGDNNLKSIYLQGDVEAVLFEHGDYQGARRTVSGSHNDLDGVTIVPFGYGTSSMKVRYKQPTKFTLYDLGDRNGTQFKSDRAIDNLDSWKRINHEINTWGDAGQSISIANGYEAILCRDQNYKGPCVRLKGDWNYIPNIQGQVSSIQLCEGDCPASASTPLAITPGNGSTYQTGSTVGLGWFGIGDEYIIEYWGGNMSQSAFEYVNAPNDMKTLSNLPASSNAYSWKVKAWNKYGEGDWSTTRTFYVKDEQPTSANINLNTETILHQDISMSADVLPQDALNLNYTWSPTPKSGQGTSSVVYNFKTAGTQTITLNISNTGGNLTETKDINVGCQSNQYLAEYFDNKTLSGDATIYACEDRINKDWGQDGPEDLNLPDLTVNTGETIYTDEARTNLNQTANSAQNTIVLSSAINVVKGDQVLILSMLGSETGIYEYNTVSGVSGTTVTLKKNLTNTYTVDSSKKVQVIKVPQYKNVTVNGTLTAHDWDGSTGGVLAFKATGTVSVPGIIKMTNSGYRGGSTMTQNPPDGGHTGEGYPGNWNSTSIDCWGQENYNGNGGGYGHGYVWVWNSHKRSSGGGGGGNNGPGNPGAGPHQDGWCNGAGGRGVSDNNLSTLFMGGGGGSGGAGHGSVSRGGAGGDGGGIILIDAKTLNVTGSIVSDGQNGESAAGSGNNLGGAGGGGAGGTIYIKAKDATIGTNIIKTTRGVGGAPAGDGAGGGIGGAGRIKVDYCDTLTGTSTDIVGANDIDCGVNNFSARWTKSQNLSAGDYVLKSKTDDGVKVWVDNVLKIDNWTNGYSEEEETVTLTEGVHNIKVEYYEDTGSAKARFDLIPSTNHAPVITTIPNQTVGIADQFTTFDLDTYVSDQDNDSVTWEITGNSALQVAKDTNNVVTVTKPTNWFGEETLHFRANDIWFDSNSVSVKFKGLACALNEYSVEYFNNNSLTGDPSSTGCETTITKDWGAGGPIYNFGDGSDGDVIISQNTIDNPIDAQTASAANSNLLYSSNPNFQAGQKILIHQTMGVNAGTYQVTEILSYSSGVITIKDNTLIAYNTNEAGEIAQVMVIKEYRNLTVNSGVTFQAKSWNGAVGGILPIIVSGELKVDGTINATGLGFRAGPRNNTGTYGYQGESSLPGTSRTTTANSNGGGGGCSLGYANGGGGGGGGHASAGTAGGPGLNNGCMTGGQAGAAIGDTNLTKLLFGGGGGAGGGKTNEGSQNYGGAGGNGGGAILVYAKKMTVNGQIQAAGTNGEVSAAGGAAGGGAAGGSIKLVGNVGNTPVDSNKLIVNGGNGGSFGPNHEKNGGNGSAGRIKTIDCEGFSCITDNFSARWTGMPTFTSGTYKFTSQADDGIKVWVDNELIIDRWSGASANQDTNKFITAGAHEIKVEYRELTGDAKVSLSWEPVAATNQFAGEYFNNMTLTGSPVKTNTVPTIYYNWYSGNPSGVNADQFSARWKGTFNFTETKYKFVTKSDNGVRLYIDNVLVIDNWVSHPPTTDMQEVTITPGVHEVKLEYFENQWDAEISLHWMPICSNEFCAQYFNDPDPFYYQPVYSNKTSTINYDWGSGGPGNGVNNNNFSARWSGRFDLSQGNYKFTSLADDGIKVWINDELLIDRWSSATSSQDLEKYLEAGNYLITVEYRELTGNAKANFSWQVLANPTPLVNVDFNENTGSSVSNKGSLTGNLTKTSVPGWSTNIPDVGGGSSVDFGTSAGYNYVETASALSGLGGLSKFTITGWVNVRNNTEGGGGNRIVDWLNFTDNGVDLVYRSDGSLQVGIDEFPDNSPARSNASKIPTDANAGNSNWRFFAVTYDPALSSGDVKFYFGSQSQNATLDKSVTYDRGSIGSNVGRLAIGHFNDTVRPYSGTHDRMFRGLIDEIQIFDKALTLNEIQFQQNEASQIPAPSNPPTVTSTPVTSVNENASYTYDVNATDPENNTLTYTLTQGRPGMTIDSSTGVISWTPGYSDSGTYTIKVTVSDGTNNVLHEYNLTVNNVNRAPTFTQIPGQTITAGQSFTTINLANYGSDPDGDSVSWSYSGNTNINVSITNNVATLTYSSWTGTNNIEFKATDPSNAYGTSTAAFTVSSAPVGTELLSSPWYLTGNNGADEEYQTISNSVLQGKTTLRVTYNLHGINALGGDASAIIFDQNGWKYVSLSDYGTNGMNGSQTVDIPLSDFTGLNLTTGSTTIHTRFWYGSAFTVDITSIKVL